MRISDWSSDVCSSDLERSVYPGIYSRKGVNTSKAVVKRMRTITNILMAAKTLMRFNVTEAFSSKVSLLRTTSLYLSFSFSAILRFRCTMTAVLTGQAVKVRSEEHTSELQSLMRISYAVFCLKKKKS